jgi:undecaprenyl-diphosphatase
LVGERTVETDYPAGRGAACGGNWRRWPVLQAVSGLGLCLAAIFIFGWVACEFDDGGLLTQFDSLLATQLHTHAQSSPITVAIFQPITAMGSMQALMVFALAVACYLSFSGRRSLSRAWLLIVSGSLLHRVLKALFPRERPYFADPFVFESSSSFPSGHAMASLICYGLLSYLLWLALPRLWPRIVAVSAVWLLVLAIGFSRLYLGAHYMSDVIGGYAAGTVWLCASIASIEVIRRSRAGAAIRLGLSGTKGDSLHPS